LEQEGSDLLALDQIQEKSKKAPGWIKPIQQSLVAPLCCLRDTGPARIQNHLGVRTSNVFSFFSFGTVNHRQVALTVAGPCNGTKVAMKASVALITESMSPHGF